MLSTGRWGAVLSAAPIIRYLRGYISAKSAIYIYPPPRKAGDDSSIERHPGKPSDRMGPLVEWGELYGDGKGGGGGLSYLYPHLGISPIFLRM